MREFCGTGRCIITCTFGISKKFDCSCLLWLSVTISTLLARHRWAKMTFNKPFYSLLLLWLGLVSFVVYFPEADWLEEILKWMNNHRTSKRQVSTFNRLAKEIQIPVLLSMIYSINKFNIGRLPYPGGLSAATVTDKQTLPILGLNSERAKNIQKSPRLQK